ncbi:inositol monophosphatase family protein [Nocardia farcinica]|uniref:Inositol-1-monophosphatase n=1 Tax=Nocardia farcinica TaxID=37329 RepID=A0A449H039_NOCFR|nr:inositol monophosphatase family protein [Nocardia farcinica]VFA91256.1 Inositol-1-monophosphatase [Nocardia farcinica]
MDRLATPDADTHSPVCRCSSTNPRRARLAPEFQCVLDCPARLNVLAVRVEAHRARAGTDECGRTRIERQVKNRLRATVGGEVTSSGASEWLIGKARRLIDLPARVHTGEKGGPASGALDRLQSANIARIWPDVRESRFEARMKLSLPLSFSYLLGIRSGLRHGGCARRPEFEGKLMEYDRLSMEVSEIAHTVGAHIRRAAIPAPPLTFAELRTRFDAIDGPATQEIRKELRALRPDAGVAEELQTDIGASGEVWVVDAIDGAVQYLQGLPHWCVSIALVCDGWPVAAVLHNPVLGETYRAADGAGSFRNGEPITPSRKTVLDAALVATNQPPFPARQPGVAEQAGRALSRVLHRVAAVRNFGPTSWQIADAAAGRIDAFWQYGVDDGNVVGGALIARQAGMVVTDLDGAAWSPGAGGFLAAPLALHHDLLALLGKTASADR